MAAAKMSRVMKNDRDVERSTLCVVAGHSTHDVTATSSEQITHLQRCPRNRQRNSLRVAEMKIVNLLDRGGSTGAGGPQ